MAPHLRADRARRSAWTPAHHVARDAVRGGSSPTYSWPRHPAPRRHVDRAAATSVATTATVLADRARRRCGGPSSMTGSGQTSPRQSSSRSTAHSQAAPRRAVASTTPGSTRQEPRRRRRRWCRGPSETRTLPWVSAPIAASTWLGSRVEAVQAEPLATLEPAPVELGDQRLAVDVEAGERHQVGEPVDRVADHLDVRDAPATAAGSGRRGRAGARRPRRRARRRRPAAPPRRPGSAGTFSKPLLALVDAVVARGTGSRQRAPRRTSSTPTPGGPPHLCAEAASADQPSGSGSRPAEAQASTKSGTPSEPARRPRRPAAGCRPRGWRTGQRHARAGVRRRSSVVEVDPAARGRRGPTRVGAPGRPGGRVQDGRVLDGGVHDACRRAARAPRCEAEQAAVHRLGAGGR